MKAGLNEKSYCLPCAHAVLELGRERLDTLFTELERVETLSD